MDSRTIAVPARPVPQQISPPETETPAPKKSRKMKGRGQAGSIYRRKNSSTWCISYRVPECKPGTRTRVQKVESFPSKQAARKRLTEVIGQVEEGKYRATQPETFSAYADKWLTKQQCGTKPGTWRTYESAVTLHLKPEFAELELREISRSDVKQFIQKLLGKKLTGKSVRNIINLLHVIFEHAIDEEICAANPAHKLKINLPDDSEERVMPEKSDLLATLSELGKTPVLQALLATAVMLGLRRGELCGLQWSDVDFRKRTITVERALVRIHQDRAGSFLHLQWVGTKAFALTAPKSKKSRRVIGMPEQLKEILRGLRESTCTDESNPYVFQNGSGGPLDMDEIADVLTAAQDRAGVKQRFTLHGVRHFFASAKHKAGATLVEVCGLLGHASVTTTARYLRVLYSGSDHTATAGLDIPSVSTMLAKRAEERPVQAERR